MELVNFTRMVAGYTMALQPDGRELLVVVVKGTFGIPRTGEGVRLADLQVPLVMADTFTGEPGLSAPLYEIDFPPRKPRCDVLVVGSAHTPDGRPTTRLAAGVQVGDMKKSLAVVGDREWRTGIAGIVASSPRPFVSMPISYDCAFGGVDKRHEDAAKHAVFMPNPIGRGFHKHLRPEWVDGSALPNTEELSRPIDGPDMTTCLPMAFGPVGRGWDPRYRYAGTYDDRWIAEEFPFLPGDFDERYYQAAPVDQQIAYPTGGEVVRLVNLSPAGDVQFTLPAFDAPIHFVPKKGAREERSMSLDTIVFEPDRGRFTLTWRTTRTLTQNIFDVAQVLIGKRSRAWWAKREGIDYPISLIQVRPERPDQDSSAGQRHGQS